jgi:hypothetical protein
MCFSKRMMTSTPLYKDAAFLFTCKKSSFFEAKKSGAAVISGMIAQPQFFGGS